MPTLVNGEMTFDFDEAIAPEALQKHRGEIKAVVTDDVVTLTFPDMISAASWARAYGLSDYTWFSKAWAAFSSAVEVDVIRPDH